MFAMVYKYIKKRVFLFIILMISNIIVNLSYIVFPYISGKYIDSLITSRSVYNVYFFSYRFIAIILTSIIFTYISNIVMVRFKNYVSLNMVDDVFEHVKRLPISFYNNIDASYLSDRINSDCNEIITFVLDSTINLVINILSLIIYLYLLYKIHSQFFLALVWIIPIYIMIYYIFKRPLYNVYYQYKEKKNVYFSKMLQQINNIQFVKLQSLFDIVRNEFRRSFLSALNFATKCVNLSSLLAGFGNIVRSSFNIFLFFYGGLEILNGDLSIGNFTIINKYASSVMKIISYFLNYGHNYQTTLSSFSRIKDILGLSKEYNGNTKITTIESIKLENVCFKYNGENILSNFTYEFQKGNIYGIIGPNGVGKSTLVNLIVGLLQDYDGNIFYDSINIRDIDLYDARMNIIGIAEQVPKFISDSIKTNISYSNLNLNNDEIISCFREYKFDNLLDKLPKGLDTPLEGSIIALSEGEKQKLSLIRALLKKPQLLILDEPTTYLDVFSVEVLKDNLEKNKHDMIIIIVTHEYNFLNICDEVLDFNCIKTLCKEAE